MSPDDAALLPPPRWRLRRQDLGRLLASSAFGVRKAASANFNPMKKKKFLDSSIAYSNLNEQMKEHQFTTLRRRECMLILHCESAIWITDSKLD